jgi:hypothetical protein
MVIYYRQKIEGGATTSFISFITVVFQGCSNKAYEKAQGFLKKYFIVFVGVAFGIAAVMVSVYVCFY